MSSNLANAAASTQEVIGVAWDKNGPNLKAQLLGDLLKIAQDMPGVSLMFLPPPGEDATPDNGWYLPLARYTQLQVLTGAQPTSWRVYIVDEEPVLPDYAEDIVRKNLTPKAAKPVYLSPNKDFYPTLERQSDLREVPVGQSLTLNKIPPRHNKTEPYSTPQNFFLSPFISLAALAVGVLLVLGDLSVSLPIS